MSNKNRQRRDRNKARRTPPILSPEEKQRQRDIADRLIRAMEVAMQ